MMVTNRACFVKSLTKTPLALFELSLAGRDVVRGGCE